MQGIELRHLRCLLAVAEEGHFGRAAQRLGTTQPAVSQLLKRLEDMMGHQLVHRGRLALSLTPVGQEVLHQARQALVAVDGALEAAQRSLRGEAGRLRLGVGAASLYGVVPGLIRRFRVARPGVVVELLVLPSQEQAAAVLERRVDAACGALGLQDARLVQRPVMVEETQVVLPIWHPLATQAVLALDALRDEAWILPPPGTTIREEMLLLCRAAGFSPRLAAESPDFITTFGLVLAGSGIALAGESFRDYAGPQLRLRPLAGGGPCIRHSLAYRADDVSPTLAAFLAMAEE